MDTLRLLFTVAGIALTLGAYIWLRRRGMFSCCIRIRPTQMRDVHSERPPERK